jgi:hypothetical protein
MWMQVGSVAMDFFDDAWVIFGTGAGAINRLGESIPLLKTAESN